MEECNTEPAVNIEWCCKLAYHHNASCKLAGKFSHLGVTGCHFIVAVNEVCKLAHHRSKKIDCLINYQEIHPMKVNANLQQVESDQNNNHKISPQPDLWQITCTCHYSPVYSNVDFNNAKYLYMGKQSFIPVTEEKQWSMNCSSTDNSDKCGNMKLINDHRG